MVEVARALFEGSISHGCDDGCGIVLVEGRVRDERVRVQEMLALVPSRVARLDPGTGMNSFCEGPFRNRDLLAMIVLGVLLRGHVACTSRIL